MELASRIYSRLHWDKALTTSNIEVEVTNGGIATVTGVVPDEPRQDQGADLDLGNRRCDPGRRPDRRHPADRADPPGCRADRPGDAARRDPAHGWNARSDTKSLANLKSQAFDAVVPSFQAALRGLEHFGSSHSEPEVRHADDQQAEADGDVDLKKARLTRFRLSGRTSECS